MPWVGPPARVNRSRSRVSEKRIPTILPPNFQDNVYLQVKCFCNRGFWKCVTYNELDWEHVNQLRKRIFQHCEMAGKHPEPIPWATVCNLEPEVWNREWTVQYLVPDLDQEAATPDDGSRGRSRSPRRSRTPPRNNPFQPQNYQIMQKLDAIMQKVDELQRTMTYLQGRLDEWDNWFQYRI